MSRKDRREQERTEAKLKKRALPLLPDNPLRQATRLRYAALLAGGTSRRELLARARAEAAQAESRVFAEVGPPACRPGCAYCCRLYVSVRADEARALADELRRLPPDSIERVRRRLAENAARARGARSDTYPKMDCALLTSDGTCSAYEARPFSCRQYHSYDVDACRRADAGDGAAVPSSVKAFHVQRETATALLEAIHASGGDIASYELQQALDILLRDPRGDLGPARESSDGDASPTSDTGP